MRCTGQLRACPFFQGIIAAPHLDHLDLNGNKFSALSYRAIGDAIADSTIAFVDLTRNKMDTVVTLCVCPLSTRTHPLYCDGGSVDIPGHNIDPFAFVP